MKSDGMTYVRFFPSDWRTGCLVLNLEEEGLYTRAVMFMYDEGIPLPDDDVKASQLLHVQIQKYQKVMASLIAKGKMIRAQGSIINERVDEELRRYRQEQFNRSEAAKRREEARKQQLERAAAHVQKLKELAVQNTPPPHAPQGVPPDVPPPGYPIGTPEVPQEVMLVLVNEINAPPATVVVEPYHKASKPLTTTKEDKKESRASRAKAATRIADDWTLPQDWYQWAVNHFCVSEKKIRFQAAKFHDYWLSRKTDPKAMKSDWQAAWRNWCRTSFEQFYRDTPLVNGHNSETPPDHTSAMNNLWGFDAQRN